MSFDGLMCLLVQVLADIEIAQSMQKEKAASKAVSDIHSWLLDNVIVLCAAAGAPIPPP